MEYLRTGNFFGETNETIHLDGLTLTDTVYTHRQVDWHFHENAYFTFILQGRLLESNKRETYHCSGGSLLFHRSQEPHYNIKPDGYTRGFHIELNNRWFEKFSPGYECLEGSFNVEHPAVKLLLYKIFSETKIFDDISESSIHALLLGAFGNMRRIEQNRSAAKPAWIKKIREILNDDCTRPFLLDGLASEVNVHPVHLSRDFSRYFHCTFGEYVRKLRIEKALVLLPGKNLSLTEIAFRCGFADQSHFLRTFKRMLGVNPSSYRKLLAKR
jgi:AraC-like DNA-binding protein